MTHEKNRWTLAKTRGVLIFLAIGVAAIIAAFSVGIEDNPPGLLFLYTGCTSIILAAVHRWQNPRSFLWLLVGSTASFFVGAILHNVLHGLADHVFPNLPAAILWMLEAASVAFFWLALVLSPSGALVGLLGWLITGVRRLQARRHEA